ncbi:hypothetical protein J3A83DRAFT_3570833 [Scleroderma citrinum]
MWGKLCGYHGGLTCMVEIWRADWLHKDHRPSSESDRIGCDNRWTVWLRVYPVCPFVDFFTVRSFFSLPLISATLLADNSDTLFILFPISCALLVFRTSIHVSVVIKGKKRF